MIAENPGVRVERRCQTCAATRNGTEQECRVAGWRIWSGTTIGGQASSVVFCPSCTGERR